KEYWKNKFADFTMPTYLGMECNENEFEPEKGYGEQTTYLSADLTQSIQQFTRQHQLTPNTLLQGAWATLLSLYSGDNDVAFGVTSSGRPAELQNVENTVAMFINTLPVRIQLPHDVKVKEWLQIIQDQQITSMQYEYSSLVDIQNWSDINPRESLFE